MGLSYLALDQADMGEPVKCSARSMAKPNTRKSKGSQEGCTLLVRDQTLGSLWRHTFPKCFSTYVDSDFAGCRSTRWSTTGMVQMVGGHAVEAHEQLARRNWIDFSECEYHGLTHRAAHGLGLRSYMADLGFEMSLEILSDSSAARALASRRGLGRQRHVQTRYLLLQERVAAGHLSIQRNIGTAQENCWTETCQRKYRAQPSNACMCILFGSSTAVLLRQTSQVTKDTISAIG